MRIALGIEYDGTDFYGWQRLKTDASVQMAVETALSRVAAHPVEISCAGRTDAGVHGRCQVVHFDTGAQRDMRSWVLGACSNLPDTVAVLWAQPVAAEFHARYAARSRRYRYHILNRPVRAALDARYVTWERLPLDAERMHEAAQALLGEHDFSAFRALSCQAAHPRRTVLSVSVRREGEQLFVEVEANAFLHHMVRNIAGLLIAIGRGDEDPVWARQVLESRDRTRAGPTAPAHGLYLWAVRYPRAFALPAPRSAMIAGLL